MARRNLGRGSFHALGSGALQIGMNRLVLGGEDMNRVVGAYDAGRIINPKTARSQAIGGIIWGTGQALLEQSETDPASGQFINRNYSGYLVPTNADVPVLDVVSLAASTRKRARLAPRVLAS